jgi:hypothetical protein
MANYTRTMIAGFNMRIHCFIQTSHLDGDIRQLFCGGPITTIDALCSEGVVVPPLTVEPFTTTRTFPTQSPDCRNQGSDEPNNYDGSRHLIGVQKSSQRNSN